MLESGFEGPGPVRQSQKKEGNPGWLTPNPHSKLQAPRPPGNYSDRGCLSRRDFTKRSSVPRASTPRTVLRLSLTQMAKGGGWGGETETGLGNPRDPSRVWHFLLILASRGQSRALWGGRLHPLGKKGPKGKVSQTPSPGRKVTPLVIVFTVLINFWNVTVHLFTQSLIRFLSLSRTSASWAKAWPVLFSVVLQVLW